MLKYRLITAAILIPITLLILFYLPLTAFFFLTALVMLVGAYEWSALMEMKTIKGRALYIVLFAVMGFLAAMMPVILLLKITLSWWILASILVCLYPKGSLLWGKSIILRGIMGVLVLIPCWVALNAIRAQFTGAYVLLYLFILIWGADTAAYFIGKYFGRHKLAPSVSPGKSWEGFIAALVAALIITSIAFKLSATPSAIWLWCYLLALMVTLFSVVGDLFESVLKRLAGVKDSGTILPGHGGLLDRIDSLTAAAPIFLLGVVWISHHA